MLYIIQLKLAAIHYSHVAIQLDPRTNINTRTVP